MTATASTSSARRGTSRTPFIVGGVLVLILVGIALIAGDSGNSSSGPPLAPSSTAPNGTRGLVLLLDELGADVRTGDRVPAADAKVALLLHDGLSQEDHDRILDWVSRGGTLVLADPSSSLSPADVNDSVFGVIDRGTCTMPELADVNRLQVQFSQLLSTAGARSCFGNGSHAFVTSTSRGAGHIVVLGDASVFTNEMLDDVDNSVLAARLLVPAQGTVVAVLDPNPPGSGRTTLSDLVPDRVFQAIVQLGIAFVLYALWRSRRVGQPVTEAQPVAIAGSQFVRAVGRLHQRTHAMSRAAAALRFDTRRTVCEQFGVPLYTDVETLARMTAERTGLDRTTVAAAFGDTPILDDEALVELGHSLDSIRQEVLDGRSH
ncbi:MAG TPA: DUF4350 domain-containing protein [Acidimicrobiales bacterium]|nr:DUF4350 domain-containing protein [Acidimicrobiales bacterium]